MTTLQTVTAGTGADTRVNENFQQASPSALYAKNPVTSTGLTWGYKGGIYNGNTIADGTVALTASTTNYVVANRSTGAVTASTTTTNWNNTATYLRLYSVVTGTTTVTSSVDYRQAIGSADADLAAHVAAADPHTQYQKESEKGVASGYASLDAGGTVPDAQIPAAIARDTEVTAAISAHEAAADPHPQYATDDDLAALGAIIADGDKGNITVSASGTVWDIDADAVTNAKLANMAQATIKGRADGAGTGDPTDLTPAQAKTLLAIMLADIADAGTAAAADTADFDAAGTGQAASDAASLVLRKIITFRV